MKSQKFKINGPKHSLSRSSILSFGRDNDDISTSRPPKRGRLSSRIHRSNTKYTALFDFKGYAHDELNFKKGDEIQVIDQDDRNRTNWWRGRIDGKEGMFPTMYVAQKNFGLSPKEIDPRDISLEESIGKGGFATVRRGIWRGGEVAVKIIRDINSADTNANKEATFYWLVRHPNIISLLGVCNGPTDFWLVMEYARGGTLNQVLSETLLPLPVVINWSTQIARAMKYLHQDAPIENIIHRDLKSKNIIIFESLSDGMLENKTLKITDFGLARQALNSIQTNVAGTFGWMAPEVFKGQPISTASDVWSFGVVLWEMLTSQVPYKNFNECQIIYGVGNNSLKLPIPRSCPKSFEKLLKRCWSINPKERPPFVQILEDLQSIQQSLLQHDIETFTTLQQTWREEIEHELETIKSESDNTMNDTNGGDGQMSYGLGSIMEGIRQRFKELEKLEMQLIEKELSLAVRQFNNIRKRRKKLNIFSWKKKRSLKISQPSNFQHNLQTIVEEKTIASKHHSPPIFVKTIRVNTNSSQRDVNMSTENITSLRDVSNYSIASGLRQVMKVASLIVSPSQSSDSPITKSKRESLLPPAQPRKPTTLAIKPCYDASQPMEMVKELPSSEEQKKSPFKVEIIQFELKSRVIISGNNPEQNDYMRQNVFRPEVENQMSASTSHAIQVSSCRLSNVFEQPQQFQPFDSFPSFGGKINSYGSLATLKSRTDSKGIASKMSYMPAEIFPYDKVGTRQSWLNLKNGKSVAELRAFFSQKVNHNKLTVN